MGPRLVCLVCTTILVLAGAAPAAAPPAVALDRYGDPLPRGVVARLGTSRLCCDRPRCLAFTADGKSLVSGGADGFIHVWDTRMGKELRRFRSAPHYAFCLAVSPDGKHLAVGAFKDNGVCLRDLATGKELRRFRGRDHQAVHLAFSPDGKLLASTCPEGYALIWDVATGKQVHRAPSAQCCIGLPGPAVAFSRDGKCLAVAAGKKPRIDIWDTSCWKVVRSLKGHRGLVVGLGFTADGKRLVSGSLDGSVRLWDVVSGKQLHCYGTEMGYVRGVVLASGGKVLAACTTSGDVHAWDTASAKELWSVDLRTDVDAIAVSPDGKMLAVATETRIGLWEADTAKPAFQCPEPAAAVSSIHFTPDGTGLVVVRDDDSVEQWDARTSLRRSRTNLGEHIVALRVLRNGDMVAAVDAGVNTDAEALELRSVPAGKLISRFPVRAATRGRTGGTVAILPDGARVAAQTTDGEFLWTATNRALRRFENRHNGPVALSANGALLAATAESGGLLLWDAETGTRLAWVGQKEGKVSALRFSPDGRSLLAWDLKSESPTSDLHVWEVASGKQRLRLKCRHDIFEADFSPDGRLLALAAMDSGVYLYDLASGKEVSRLDGHLRTVHDLAFSPDGKLLVTGGEDTTVLVWQTSRLAGPWKRRPARLSAERAEELWRDLGSADAERAHRAIWTWADHPKQAVAFLGRRLRKVEPATVRRLIGQLDDDNFAVREKASRELGGMGLSAGREMREALKRAPSLEVSLRLRRLLRKLLPGQMSGEELRQFRAREALERIGTPEARRLLAGHAHAE
jgi:WD40 repeat protein